MTLQEIRARKAQHVAAMRAVLNKATTEKRALSADEATQCDAMKADIESLEAQESRVAFLDEQERRRSEEHTSELQSLMRISYAVFCLKKKNNKYNKQY